MNIITELLDLEDENYVNYGVLYNNRFKILQKVFEIGRFLYASAYEEFKAENNSWLNDYSLFMALKKHFDMKCWIFWDDEGARLRKPEVLDYYRKNLFEDIEFNSFCQFLFYKQWNKLKEYANNNGIKIIGDLPIYAPLDSCDVWVNSKYFLLDERNIPTCVAGVPPDYFNEDGQVWGNPIYDWQKLKNDGYGWWINRIKAQGKLFDSIRFDHFRGLSTYYAIPYGDKTARNGHWEQGAGRSFIEAVQKADIDISINAEDLGYLTDEVKELLSYSKWPGMKVLQFAFNPWESQEYDPRFYPENSVCYTGTHDNTTLKGWLDSSPEEFVTGVCQQLGLPSREGAEYKLIEVAMNSNSNTVIIPLQDYFGFGSEARINTPGKLGGNWQWRLNDSVDWNSVKKRIVFLCRNRIKCS